MKKILFPTDFSKIAENAFIYALRLANRIQGEIILLHVYDQPDLRGSSLRVTVQGIFEERKREEKEAFDKSIEILNEIAKKDGKEHIPISKLLIQGEIVPTVKRVAEGEKADFVVMGTKGATGLKELFLGSNATGVMDILDIPVISIPEEATLLDKIQKIVFTTNYTEEDTLALDEVVYFADAFKAEVHCIHFNTDKEEYHVSDMNNIWKDEYYTDFANVSFKTVDTNNMEEGLEKYCEKENINIVAMLSHKKNIIEKIFSSSISKQMVNHTDVPIFSIPDSLIKKNAMKE
ncbi:universal stress protein [Aureivirga sp. CE67]|uniref:universal stress protein n=1 Tax=Aureivirga sp. CE67 TaxID=1788983 RepID=UPI0018C9FD57|nr:universal stress protein [Aureivirga sp. CE67]